MSPSKVPVRIIVDVHERQSGIAETLSELGAEIEVAPLSAGGVDTLVERKRVLDLHAAILKGRLWPQLGKLRAACAFPYLLVEGTDIDRGPLHANAIRPRGNLSDSRDFAHVRRPSLELAHDRLTRQHRLLEPPGPRDTERCFSCAGFACALGAAPYGRSRHSFACRRPASRAG